jgi:glycyl-tRNA synthetase
LSFPPTVAPTKVLIVPLSSHADFKPFVRTLSDKLQEIGISTRVDDSGASIGKRYSVSRTYHCKECALTLIQRNDELGTPLGITIDFQSVKDNSFTLRDRDSTEQVRAGLEEITNAISSLVNGREKWSDVAARLPKFEGQEVD